MTTHVLLSKQSIQYGENLNTEYVCNINLLHFFFQLIRNTDTTDLENQLETMIGYFKKNSRQYRQELIHLYKMIGHTRDIHYGRGEYSLAYMQLWIWYKYYPDLAIFAFSQFVQGAKYGCWKDIKFFCEYIHHKTGDKYHPLILTSINILVTQLKYDIQQFENNKPISLAAKWTPREKSRFKWIYTQIAVALFPQFLITAKNPESKYKAELKAKINLRKKIAKMNKKATNNGGVDVQKYVVRNKF